MTRIFRHEPFDFRNIPPATRALMIATLVGFAAGLIVPEIRSLFGLVPEQTIFHRWLWQPFTYLFLQSSVLGLVFNLIALWFFGMPVEAQWGEREFLKYYFLCGLSTAAVHLGANPHSAYAVTGPSGAVFGMLAAFAMLYPDAVVYIYFMIPVRAAHMAIFYGLFEFFSGLGGSGGSGPARFAGLAGLLTGYVYIRWWWVAKIQLKALWRRAASAEPEDEPAPRAIPRRAVKPKPKAPPVDSDMAEVDRILDKILSDGLESLTDDEKGVMHKYSERNKPS